MRINRSEYAANRSMAMHVPYVYRASPRVGTRRFKRQERFENIISALGLIACVLLYAIQ